MSDIRETRKRQDAALQKAYTLCADYDYLRMALEHTPVFGVVDYDGGSGFVPRDVVMIKKLADGRYLAGVRGVSYCESFMPEGWDGFLKQAQKYNLAFVIPHRLCSVDTPSPEKAGGE